MGKLMFSHVSIMMLLLFATHGCATGSQPGKVTIAGTIRLVGNEPFARLVLTPNENGGKTRAEQDYLLIGPLTGELKRRYQLRRVRLEGSLCVSPLSEFARCFKPSGIVENPDQRQ